MVDEEKARLDCVALALGSSSRPVPIAGLGKGLAVFLIFLRSWDGVKLQITFWGAGGICLFDSVARAHV